ncbi:murein L,D-transpeptidase family protein [Dokdonella sp.]|uniref:L,D-transpeptidase family protein n=1 Tax=Dokdonella sp. TaxID=2291710 RepID=UPI0035284CF9
MQETGLIGSSRAQQAALRVRPKLDRELSELGLLFGDPVFMRIFKQEKQLELWVESDTGKFVLFRSYPICAYSGGPGPKLRQGDKQAPEGFYSVAAGQLNPNSRYHLAFDLGYPNTYDRLHGRTGDFLMVHGNCVSVGCYAMGDAGIEEIYSMAAAALEGGQRAIEVHAFPFRLDAERIEAWRNAPWFEFWMELKPAYDLFEQTRVPPEIGVRGRHYSIGKT